MRKLCLAFVGCIAAAPTLAADLPRRAPAAAPVYAAPIFTWSGFYVGAQIGYGWGKHKSREGNLANGEDLVFNTKGMLGGVHAGYNWQRDALVYGLEGDLELGNVSDAFTLIRTDFSASTKARGSLRVRVGYAFDRVLIYTTGGLAVGRNAWRQAAANAVTGSATSTGWTVGAGVEYAFTNALSARAEYRYTDFGNEKYTISINNFTASLGMKTSDHAVRVGLSYRFGGPAGPILARY